MHVLITGANRGIGLQLARDLSARGDTVLATARGTDHPDIDGVTWLNLEVTKPTSHDALAKTLDGAGLDLVVCNAGVYLDKDHELAEGYAADLWADTFAVNVTGVFLTAQNLLPNLQAAKAGKIAIIGSNMGATSRAPGGSYIYRASKAAVLNLGRNLATDLRGLNIPVGVYHPGWVRTDMGSDAAEISVQEAATGLIARFDALNMQNTGCFESWDGETYAY